MQGVITLWFWFVFPDDCWASFHAPIGHLYIFFGKMFVQSLHPFFKLDCLCFCYRVVSVLYIFWILTLLSDIWFANILSYSIDCLFILLTVYFAVQKLFSLMQSHLLISAIITCAFGVISKKIIVKTNVKELFSFSYRSFMISGLMFKSLIHLELIFVNDVR